jgi:nanoRNase/pAp phosphatase (c-di-AMP/oligoRNAs hydrolase)
MEKILEIKNSIESGKNIGILTKIDASDDAIGATLALFFALRKINKKTFFPLDEVPDKIYEILKEKEQKKFHISFKEDISEVYYEKNNKGIDLYLTPKSDDINNESYSCKVISGTESLLSDSPYDILITVGIQEFQEVEEMCSNNLDQLYGCTVINIDTDLNNQNYGEINLVEDSQSLSQAISCLIKSFGQEYMNAESANFLLYGLTTSPKNVYNKKNIPTVKWLFKKGGNLNLISRNEPKIKILEFTLNNLIFSEDENIYVSTLSEKNMLDSNATSKDISYTIEKIKNFFKIPSFLLLWESRTSPLSIKGIFYSENKSDISKITNNFKGVSKNNGAMFLTEESSISLAKDKVLSCLK